MSDELKRDAGAGFAEARGSAVTETWGERYYRMAFMAVLLNSMFVWWFQLLCFVLTMVLWLSFNPRPKEQPPNEKVS